MTKRVLDLDPKTYQRHPIHGENRIWAETNCYVDLWVELAHAMGHEPAAALPFTFAIDFEGDQWTFFKFPLTELQELFGLDVQELAIWRPVVQHIEEQVGHGRPVLVEVDSFYLPDTAGTAYKTAHVKTTIAVVEIDREQRRLGYFHNAGYYEVSGEDFDGLMLTEWPLPPYTEFVKVRREGPDGELLAKSLALFRKHLALVPSENPFLAFKARMAEEVNGLLQESLETFHQYSFATLRQFGACFELCATYLQWLTSQGEEGLEELTREFLEIAEGAKAFQFQLARAMARKKPLDLTPLEAMAERWERGIGGLKARYA
ncbi:MAG TPA: DUF1839 family protein [Thermoanaerobaculia bacterium]|jgi:hypothetical protein